MCLFNFFLGGLNFLHSKTISRTSINVEALWPSGQGLKASTPRSEFQFPEKVNFAEKLEKMLTSWSIFDDFVIYY